MLVEEAGTICYSDKDIKNLLDDDVTILRYSDLSKFNTVDELLGNKSCACILYMTKNNYGHWTALIKNTGGEICYEIFDSYGIFPDDELKFIDEKYKLESNQFKKHLTLLLSKVSRKIPIYYNKYELQSKKKIYDGGSINTCGRWCAFRCFLKRFNIKEFISLFKNQMMPPDMIISYLTILNR